MNASLLDVNRTESRCQDLTGGQQIGLQDKDSIWPVVILAILLQLTTVCLNVTVIIRVNRSGQNKAQTRFLLTSMACVDLFVGLAIITYNILNMVFGLRQFFGLAFCDLFNAVDVVLSSASVLHLTGLTLERYIAICHPFRYHKLCSKLRFVVIYMSVWSMLITSACIVFIFRIHTYGLDINVLSCLEQKQHACVFFVGKYFVTIGTALTIAIPGILIVFFNVKLFKHVRTLSVRSREMCEATRRPSQESMGIRVAKTVVILTGSFLACWLPFTIINVTSAYLSMRPVLSDAFMLALWLGYLNSAESLKSDYVPRDQYDAVDEKCEHAATRVRLAEVVEQLESAVAEVTNLQQQLIDQKARYEKQQGTLKSKNMQDTAKAMKLQSKCSEMSQHFEKQEAILTAKDEEIANLERRIKEQGLLYRKEMSEADIEKKQQRYIARLLEEEERKRSRNPSTVTRNNTNTARNPAQMGVPKTKGKKK
ncbi:ADRB2-like protein [Mya arenaria]|uniref:ADRB2-like protein n=1 Tax=Mya arenaria TaxID=6604 RepID=A0ABY7FH54_MYAAR|nr:ADRB2-like protein [Mya arenaria]